MSGRTAGSLSGRRTLHPGVGRDVSRHNGTGTDHGVVADGYTREHHARCTYEDR